MLRGILLLSVICILLKDYRYVFKNCQSSTYISIYNSSYDYL